MRVKDHNHLFAEPEYRELFETKRSFEDAVDPAEADRVAAWTRGGEYREKNFARQALTVDPAKACQPLGAFLAAAGFAGTLPFAHGSQGCAAYFRSHFNRHFKEPFAAVSDSMTEEAAVFGGLNNLLEGLENARALYRPEMIAVCTTCMAEVIGDDLSSFIQNAREKGVIPADFPVPFAHTPSFAGSHLTGYDNMLRGILSHLSAGRESGPGNGRLYVVPGFDGHVGDLREVRRLLAAMEVPHTLVPDYADRLDSPLTGRYELYPGGTPLEEAADCGNALAAVCLQRWSTQKTAEFLAAERGREVVTVPMPVGIRNTDRLLEEVRRLTGRAVPPAILAERGRAVDAMADSHPYVHGRRVALAGDPDLVLGLISLLRELGAEVVHVVSTNGDAAFTQEAEALLAEAGAGPGAVHTGRDLWHLRSLVLTDPVDLLIGSSQLKWLAREAGLPLVRVGFPLMDRHHLHRYPIVGYQGALNLTTWIVNTVLDELDRSSDGRNFDFIR